MECSALADGRDPLGSGLRWRSVLERRLRRVLDDQLDPPRRLLVFDERRERQPKIDTGRDAAARQAVAVVQLAKAPATNCEVMLAASTSRPRYGE